MDTPGDDHESAGPAIGPAKSASSGRRLRVRHVATDRVHALSPWTRSPCPQWTRWVLHGHPAGRARVI